MFDTVEIPKTSSWARHLRRMSRISKFNISGDLEQLANTNDFDTTTMPDIFGPEEIESLQYIKDWRGRCVVLDRPDVSLSRYVLVKSTELLGSRSILVMSQSKAKFEEWHKVIRELYPNDNIVMVQKDIKGCTSVGSPDNGERTWVFSSLKTFPSHNDILHEYKIDHFLMDQTVSGNFGHSRDWQTHGTVEAVASEIPRSTFLINVNQFWINPEDYKSTEMINQITLLVSSTLQISTKFSKIIELRYHRNVSTFAKTRGCRIDLIPLLEVTGVCFNLILERTHYKFQNISSNLMLIDDGENSGRRREVIKRYKGIEQSVINDESKSISDLIELAVDGDTNARQALDKLKTQEWAKLKASVFYNTLLAEKRASTKTLIVTNNEHIYRFMMVSLQAVDGSKNGSDSEKEQKLANFVYPAPEYKSFKLVNSNFRFKAFNTLIVRDIGTIDDRVLGVVDNLIMCEHPYDSADLEDCAELSKVFNFKLLLGTMRGTFEEPLYKRLIKNI